MINLEDLRERKAVNCFTHDFKSIPDEIKSSGKIFVRMTASPLVDLLFKKMALGTCRYLRQTQITKSLCDTWMKYARTDTTSSIQSR